MLRWIVLLASFCLPCAYGQPQTFSTADLEGDVLDDSTGRPIAGAHVKLHAPDLDPIYLTADERGHFQIAGVDSKYCWMSTRTPGYVDLPQSTCLQMRTPVEKRYAPVPHVMLRSAVVNGSLHVTVTLRLVPYAVITGRITGPYNTPLFRCSVQLAEKRPAALGGEPELVYRWSSQTNDRGEYRLAPVDPGTYYLVAEPQFPKDYRKTYYPGVIDTDTAKQIVLGAGQRLRADLQIIQKTGVRVAGHIIKPPGSEGADQALYTYIYFLRDPHNAFEFHSTTQRDDYQIKELLPGRYTVIATATTKGPEPSWEEGKALAGLMRTIEIGAQDMDNVDLTLVPLRDISGTVSFPDGCSPVPVRISGQPTMIDNPSRQVEAATDSDGHFTLQGLHAGTYKLVVNVPVDAIRQGARDVLKDGLESPAASDEPLEIIAGCYQRRAP